MSKDLPMRFSEIPSEEFPMNHTKYTQVMDLLREAHGGFNSVRRIPGASAVSERLSQAITSVSEAWDEIQEIERRERAADPAL